MVYQNKLVAAIKVAGQILRENGSSVVLPFGCEYSILLKNLNSVRVQVKVSVDGKDATEGTWLVIQQNNSLELERFISNGNLYSGNRFRFIKRTRNIENHRGVKIEDGIIRVEYKTEKVQRVEDVAIRRHYYNDWSWDWTYYPPYPRPYYPRPYWTCNQTFTSHSTAAPQSMMARCSAGESSASFACNNQVSSDAGITVPGSHSQQQFHPTSSFSTYEDSEVLVINLFGEIAGKKVAKPVFVKSKAMCSTCGKKSKSTEQFCSKCGTSVQVF